MPEGWHLPRRQTGCWSWRAMGEERVGVDTAHRHGLDVDALRPPESTWESRPETFTKARTKGDSWTQLATQNSRESKGLLPSRARLRAGDCAIRLYQR